MTLKARTMTELKAKIRKAMCWPDRRSWTPEEHWEVAVRFSIQCDHRAGLFTATERPHH